MVYRNRDYAADFRNYSFTRSQTNSRQKQNVKCVCVFQFFIGMISMIFLDIWDKCYLGLLCALILKRGSTNDSIPPHDYSHWGKVRSFRKMLAQRPANTKVRSSLQTRGNRAIDRSADGKTYTCKKECSPNVFLFHWNPLDPENCIISQSNCRRAELLNYPHTCQPLNQLSKVGIEWRHRSLWLCLI